MLGQNSSQITADGVDVAEVGGQIADAQGRSGANSQLTRRQRHTLHIFAGLLRMQAGDLKYFRQGEGQRDCVERHHRRRLAARNLTASECEQSAHLICIIMKLYCGYKSKGGGATSDLRRLQSHT